MQIKVLHQLFIRTNTIEKNRPSIWFIHGFADSGLAYKEVFKTSLNNEFNLYLVDMPGFGVSPLQQEFLSIKAQAQLLTKIITEETSDQGKITLVAHSLGALIGTWVCQNLEPRINHYCNIEGNLTEADSYFSSKPLLFTTADEFVSSFEKEVFEKAKSEERYRRYYSSLRFAKPDGMRNWGFTSKEHITGNKCGLEFKGLKCNKTYIWGTTDTPMETQKFIKDNSIPNKKYSGVGHWIMIENSEEFYNDMFSLIAH